VKPEDAHSIYMIGIGGIGMSALARWFLHRGCRVAGYDRVASPITRTLTQEGAEVHYEEDPGLIPFVPDLVVVTPAIPETHIERQYLASSGIPVLKRAQALGLICRGRKTIAVAGTHGKTTITALTAWLLRSAGIDCTAFIGGIALNFQSNFVAGADELFVVEADEYDRSFLELVPDTAVISALDPDHLDIYGDMDNMLSGFREFVNKRKPGGRLVVRQGLGAETWVPERERITYGLDPDSADMAATGLSCSEGIQRFTLHWQGKEYECAMSLPGRHNVENAMAALSTALPYAGALEILISALKEFRGIKRRFEYIINRPGLVYIDDYAHHPREIEALIRSVREIYPGRKLTVVFQPHLYTRTRDLADGFAGALSEADEVILLPIYPARELPLPGVSSALILDKLRVDSRALAGKSNLLDIISQWSPEVLLTVGAGDIDQLVDPIREYFKHSNKPSR